jgi:hypothetical protein
VVGAVAHHGEADVAAATGEGHEGVLVALVLGPLPVVIGPRGRVPERREGRNVEGPLKATVAALGSSLTADR